MFYGKNKEIYGAKFALTSSPFQLTLKSVQKNRVNSNSNTFNLIFNFTFLIPALTFFNRIELQNKYQNRNSLPIKLLKLRCFFIGLYLSR